MSMRLAEVTAKVEANSAKLDRLMGILISGERRPVNNMAPMLPEIPEKVHLKTMEFTNNERRLKDALNYRKMVSSIRRHSC